MTVDAPSWASSVAYEPGIAKPDPILSVEGVRRQFGGLVAVDVEHMQVQRGAITALIGPNGAGKTTLFNLLTGFDKPDSGCWRFADRDLSGVPAHKVAHHGMVRTFQLTKSLALLTVMENMKLGATGQRGEKFFSGLVRPLWRKQERDIEARADALLERFKLSHLRDEFAGGLSGGQRKLLEFARALMTEPKLLMLDEPMAGINPTLGARLLEHMERLRTDDGVTFLFVEHDMEVVMNHSDRVIVMAEGRVIADGEPNEVRSDKKVIDAYLGGA